MSNLAQPQLPPPPPPPQWVLDLASTPIPKPKSTSLPDPPGYTSSTTLTTNKRPNNSSSAVSKSTTLQQQRKPPTPEEMDTLKLKKAWEVAIGPAKSLPMSGIGMWMSGNTLQIFSIFMLFQLFKAPITGLLSLGTQFARFETEGRRQEMLMAKAVFVLCNLAGIALGIWKIDKMGLLPTTRSDWLAWEPMRTPMERAVPGYSI